MSPRELRLSRDPAARRRLAALLATAVAALVAGLASGGGSSSDDAQERSPSSPAADRPQREAPVDRLTLEQQVGQVLVSAFPGSSAPAYLRRRLRAGQLAGVVLFGENVTTARELIGLTRAIQDSAGGGALVAADQEGGDIRIVRFAGPAEPQSGTGGAEAARSRARAAARGLRGVGVNVTLAPVADVARGGALAGRSFPGDPAAVSRIAAAAVRGWAAGRVAATAKHFPGLGGARSNTDDAEVAIPGRLGADLAPFRAAIAAGAPIVMAGHALYPAYDRRRIASQSPAILGDLLRRRLRFRGAVVTDSIEARAVLARSSVQQGAERSVAAGADLVLMTGSGSWKLVYPRLLRRARASKRFRARVRAAAARVLALKQRLGLRPRPTAR
ncbi:MAG: glycoside hydrolase family 3 N-terminal domain-containing protein [Solirubrobacteraceae bacterium]